MTAPATPGLSNNLQHALHVFVHTREKLNKLFEIQTTATGGLIISKT